MGVKQLFVVHLVLELPLIYAAECRAGPEATVKRETKLGGQCCSSRVVNIVTNLSIGTLKLPSLPLRKPPMSLEKNAAATSCTLATSRKMPHHSYSSAVIHELAIVQNITDRPHTTLAKSLHHAVAIRLGRVVRFVAKSFDAFY